MAIRECLDSFVAGFIELPPSIRDCISIIREAKRRCRVRERDDRQDISDLLVRYATGIDRRDWALFRTVFTDDCELDYGEIGAWTGVDAVTNFMEQVHAMAGHTLHRLSNQVITLDGDRATARTYVDALIMAGDNTSGVAGVAGVNGIGFYDDEVVRIQDGWRIARRRFTVVRVTSVD